METLKAKDIRLQYSEKLCDQFLEAGFRAWLKRQVPRKSNTKLTQINKKLKELDQSELKRLLTKIKCS